MGRASKYPSVELVVNVLTGYSSQNMILHVEGNTDGGLDVRKGNFLFYLGKILSLNSGTCSDLASEIVNLKPQHKRISLYLVERGPGLLHLGPLSNRTSSL